MHLRFEDKIKKMCVDTFSVQTPQKYPLLIERQQNVLYHSQKKYINMFSFLSALVYNFGEGRKNPDKSRQKYLDQFFGPTAIAGSALRAFRNPFFAFTFRSWYDLVFHTKNMTEVLSKAHISAFRDTILSEPWLHAKIFRDVCSFFFTSIGWTTYYVW
jgi:hypothetical protein